MVAGTRLVVSGIIPRSSRWRVPNVNVGSGAAGFMGLSILHAISRLRSSDVQSSTHRPSNYIHTF